MILEQLVGILEAVPDFETTLNTKRHLLSIRKGVIDLRTGKFRKRVFDDRMNYELPIDKPCELPDDLGSLGEFLNSLFIDDDKEEMKNFLQTFLGICLTGEVKDQLLMVWLGEKGGNGKSLLLSLMGDILGNLYSDISSCDITVGVRDEACKKLFGKLIDVRMGVVEETQNGDRLHLGMVKKMTGLNDTTLINSKKLYKHQHCYPFYFKLLISTNTLPTFPDDTALFRRLIVFPFKRYFRCLSSDSYDIDDRYCGIRDDTLFDRIKAEKLFLPWLIEGCKKYYADKTTFQDKLPSTISDFTRAQRKENDLLGNYLEDHCDIEKDAFKTFKAEERISPAEFHERFSTEVTTISTRLLSNLLKKKGIYSKPMRIATTFLETTSIKRRYNIKWKN